MKSISYTNKSALNQNDEIADTNKCNAGDLNEIKSVVNYNASECGNAENLQTTNKTSLVAGINEIKGQIENLCDYSSSEVDTGKTWVDGKPIYRKVLNFTTSASDVTGWTDATKISDNVENLINIYGYTFFGNNKTPLPRYESPNYYLIFLAVDNMLKYRSVGFYSTNCNLAVEYTKTTD